MSKKGNDGAPEASSFDWRAFTAKDSPKGLPDTLRDFEGLMTAAVEEGDDAFDFESPVADFSTGIERSTGEIFHLQAVAGSRPVALVFGSYT